LLVNFLTKEIDDFSEKIVKKITKNFFEKFSKIA